MRTTHIGARWGALPLLGLFCLALVGCGGTASARTSSTATPARPATPTTTTIPLPNGLPYSFPGAWHDASGLPLLDTPDSTAYGFAPSAPLTGYACNGASGAFYVTHDGGDSWQAQHISAFARCGDLFLDAHDASDIFTQTTTTANSVPNGFDLWRSRDGGATWAKLGVPPSNGLQLVWNAIAVFGSRVIGQAYVNQEGFIQNALFVSDNGGATWGHFAQSVANQGYTISSFVIINSAIYIASVKGTTPGGMQARLEPGLMAAPLSGLPGARPIWWRSLDGGATWRQVTLPGYSLQATPAVGGRQTYALSVTGRNVAPAGQPTVYDATIWWSADGGATWKKLPDMAGLEGGYVIGGDPVALAPDGSVYAYAQHDPQGADDDAGVFRIQPGDAASTWQPLAPGGTQAFAANVTPAGARLWSIGSQESDSYLKYVTVA